MNTIINENSDDIINNERHALDVLFGQSETIKTKSVEASMPPLLVRNSQSLWTTV